MLHHWLPGKVKQASHPLYPYRIAGDLLSSSFSCRFSVIPRPDMEHPSDSILQFRLVRPIRLILTYLRAHVPARPSSIFMTCICRVIRHLHGKLSQRVAMADNPNSANYRNSHLAQRLVFDDRGNVPSGHVFSKEIHGWISTSVAEGP